MAKCTRSQHSSLKKMKLLITSLEGAPPKWTKLDSLWVTRQRVPTKTQEEGVMVTSHGRRPARLFGQVLLPARERQGPGPGHLGPFGVRTHVANT